MQDNFMEYPEVYYLMWWHDELAAAARFTLEKDLSGEFIVDKTKRCEIIWAKDKTIRIWLEKAILKTPFARKQITEDKHKFIIWIFGEPRG